MKARILLSMSAAIVLALTVPAGASAVTFGADLSRPADSPYDCTLAPSTIGGPLEGLVGSGAQTCTWWTIGANLGSDLSEGHVVPYGGGTITKARVKVGPTTGPMQIVVLRSLRHPGSLGDVGCCFPVGHSEVFTPAPNGITEVPMNVAARHDTDPASGVNNYDHIALSVLAPGVPVPADYTGASLYAPSGGSMYPHYEPGTERVTGYGALVGFQVLINADIEKTTTGGTTTGPVDPGVNPLTLGAGLGPVQGSRIGLPFVCSSAEECAGLVRLQQYASTQVRSSGRVQRAEGGKTYGKSNFAIPGGTSQDVPVKLNKAGKKLLKRKKQAKVYVNASLASGQTLSQRITLKRQG